MTGNQINWSVIVTRIWDFSDNVHNIMYKTQPCSIMPVWHVTHRWTAGELAFLSDHIYLTDSETYWDSHEIWHTHMHADLKVNYKSVLGSDYKDKQRGQDKVFSPFFFCVLHTFAVFQFIGRILRRLQLKTDSMTGLSYIEGSSKSCGQMRLSIPE